MFEAAAAFRSAAAPRGRVRAPFDGTAVDRSSSTTKTLRSAPKPPALGNVSVAMSIFRGVAPTGKTAGQRFRRWAAQSNLRSTPATRRGQNSAHMLRLDDRPEAPLPQLAGARVIPISARGQRP